MDNRWRTLLHIHFADFAFIHINKCAGSSIERALGIPLCHKTALEYRAAIGDRRWDRIFTFSFVRNPWDRVVSQYHYRVKSGQNGLDDRSVPFDRWVVLAYERRDPRYHDDPKMFMPQVRWLCDASGRILVDFVGRFEALRRDFDIVCSRLGRPRVALPHTKRSVRGDYRAYYSDRTAEIVARRFAADIETFGYAFGSE